MNRGFLTTRYFAVLVLVTVASSVLLFGVLARSVETLGAIQSVQSTDSAAEVGTHLYMRVQSAANEIEGPVTLSGREGTIAILSYSQSVWTPREASTGMATGRRLYQPLTVLKQIDQTSPLLAKALGLNEECEVWLYFWIPTGTGAEIHFYTIHLEEAYISSIRGHMAYDPTGADSLEEVSFVFVTITWTYETTGAEFTDSWYDRV
jgi:type VI secretion system secreted protein Hcp